jgi:26S proteasome regulatory subunit T1
MSNRSFQGAGPYDKAIKETEEDVQTILKRVNELSGIKESDTGLAPPALWDLAADKQALQSKPNCSCLISSCFSFR